LAVLLGVQKNCFAFAFTCFQPLFLFFFRVSCDGRTIFFSLPGTLALFLCFRFSLGPFFSKFRIPPSFLFLKANPHPLFSIFPWTETRLQFHEILSLGLLPWFLLLFFLFFIVTTIVPLPIIVRPCPFFGAFFFQRGSRVPVMRIRCLSSLFF